MRYSQRHVLVQAATALAVVTALSGCASQEPDGVLWRQVAVFKDPFGRSLVSAIETTTGSEDLADGIRDGSALAGDYWDGDSSLDAIPLVKGGLVIHNLEEHNGGLSFEVMINSGPRNARADPLARQEGPYFGPTSVFTCSEIIVDFESQPRWGWIDEDCDPALTERLDAGGQLVSINEFHG